MSAFSFEVKDGILSMGVDSNEDGDKVMEMNEAT